MYIKNYVNDKYKSTKEDILKQHWEARKQKTAQRIEDKTCLKIVLKDNNERIIGYGFLIELDQDQLWLKNIIVDPEFQRQGYCQKIVGYLLLNSPEKDILLETTTASTFYEKFGF